MLRDFLPAVAVHEVIPEDLLLLFLAPLVLVDVGVQMVDPSLPALLTAAIVDVIEGLHLLRDEGPVLTSMVLNEFPDGVVLLPVQCLVPVDSIASCLCSCLISFMSEAGIQSSGQKRNFREGSEDIGRGTRQTGLKWGNIPKQQLLLQPPMPKAVERKGKDAISKAASQKKGGVKKWTKGKVKEKVNNAVFLDKAGYDKIIADIPKMGKLISVSTIIEKFKISGSITRVILRQLLQSGSLKRMDPHSKQFVCVTTVVPAKKTEEAGAKGAQKGATKKGGKKDEKAEKAEKTDKADKTGKADKAEKTDKADKAEKQETA